MSNSKVDVIVNELDSNKRLCKSCDIYRNINDFSIYNDGGVVKKHSICKKCIGDSLRM